jgi:hypothetical protein
MDIPNPSRVVVALAAALALAGIAACHEHQTSKVAAAPSQPSPAAQLIGTPPAAPTGDPPGTTPVTANTAEVTKTEETTQQQPERK